MLKRLTSLPAWLQLSVLLVLIVVITICSPMERTLGSAARLVYLHGAWVWSGKLAFAAAALTGLIGLLMRKAGWQLASRALGYSGLVFWVTYLPMSLWVQQLNWGGIFWDEPRWKVPLALGITAVLLQAGLAVINDLRVTSSANIVFGAALWVSLGSVQNVLHPDSPILTSDAVRIQVFFFLLLFLSVIFGAVLSRFFYRWLRG